MSVKINELQIENVKRIKAVKIEPTQNGLTIIGGRNSQGKTSVLDSIAYALGGNSYKPSEIQNQSTTLQPYLKVTLNNGIVVERKGKNSTLKVTDPQGRKSGQTLLNDFIEDLALNLPKFMNSNNKEKAKTLLSIIGVEKELNALEAQERKKYEDRLMTGRIADQKRKYADELVYYEDAPNELLSPSDLINQQQEILARNGENAKKRNQLSQLEQYERNISNEILNLTKQMQKLQEELDKKIEEVEIIRNDIEIGKKDVMTLVDESTVELENNIRNIEAVNIKVRSNMNKIKANDEAEEYNDQYKALTNEIEKIRENKMKLLNNADLPLPELSIQDGELTYKGFKWDNMSGSDQLKVATAIIRKLKPDCGFVLVDKLEQMDTDTIKEFGEWLENENLQVIATRVSTGDECSIIIEDGYVKQAETIKQDGTSKTSTIPRWNPGSVNKTDVKPEPTDMPRWGGNF